jgi:hypothetical protein
MQSDLVGVLATIALVVLFGLTLLLFLLAGPVAGLVFGVAVVALGLYLVSGSSRGPADIADIAPPSAESAQRVLVVANQGLENPALESELALRAQRGPLEVRLIAPVLASSPARSISDDFDAEAARARERVEAVLGKLGETDITASGHVDEEASPTDCLLDGLREFPADEVLLTPGDELDWHDAESLADRVRAESGVRVTELGG